MFHVVFDKNIVFIIFAIFYLLMSVSILFSDALISKSICVLQFMNSGFIIERKSFLIRKVS